MRPIVFIFFLLLTGFNLRSQCMAGFTFADNGLTVHFTDASMGGGSPITAWSWNFGDGTTSNQQNPMHTFPDAEDYFVCLTITTQNGCNDQFCFEIDICTLLMSASVNANCDLNGQISVNVTISDPLDQANSINVTVDGVLVSGSPFNIEDDEPVILVLTIPGDGLSHTIFAQSEDIGHCNAEFTFTAPDCNSNCFLSALNIQFAGGVLHDINIGDDFFSPDNLTIQAGDIVKWTWIGDGHSTTSDATTGPDSWNSGVLGQGATYQRTIYNPGLHPYYCIPHGGPGGAGMSATLVANCPAGNNFTLNISFNTTQANPQGYNLLLDGIVQPGSPFQYSGTGQNTVSLPLAGDGTSHTIEIHDVADPTCMLMGQVNAPDCGAAPSCMLGVSASVTSGCDPANMVDVALEVTSINGGAGGFRVRVDGVIVLAQVDYHPSGTTTVTIPVTGNGGSHNIIAEDIGDPTCSASTSIITENCTIPCLLSGLNFSTGTPTTHTVQVQDFQFAPQHITITSGDRVSFLWTGEVQHTSTSDATNGPDSWDSGLLGNGSTFLTPVLSEGVHPYYCIPHGAPGGIGMSGTITVAPDCTNGEVALNVSFVESGGGFSGFNVLIDQNIAAEGPFAYDVSGNNSVVVFVPGDGQQHQITVKDIDDPGCTISETLITPNCNASLCQLDLMTSIEGECDIDQQIMVQATVSSLNGGASGFRILVDGIVSGDSPYAYDLSGTTIINLLLAGDGAQHIIVAEDIEDPLCNAGTNLTLPDCSLSCQIFDLEALPAVATTHIVEVHDFAFVPQHIPTSLGDTVRFIWTGAVAHTTTSDATTGPDTWDSGLMTSGATFDVIISEAGVHHYYCIPHGAPGGIGMSGTITTLADCENGMVNVNLAFQQSGGSLSGFFITVDGDIVNPDPIPYDLTGYTMTNVFVNGDGMIHTIGILDASDMTCGATLQIVTADCNAVPCSLSVEATVAGGCTQAGLVPVAVVITSVSGSAEGFNVFADGIIVPGSPFIYDPSGMTMLEIFLPGNNAMHQIFVHDLGDVSCTAIVPIETPDCSGQCTLNNFSIEFAQPAKHIVEVRDFEFFPKHLNITLGDTVRFVWMGLVAHTSTSDAESGPDSWDSGLLGHNAVFELVLTTPGTHPYYCIPHGAPGGIGMSGTITVDEICTSGMLSTHICFTASNGSFAGYEILIDGVIHGPYAYTGVANCTLLDVTGDGLSHTVIIRDLEIGTCVLDTTLIFPDCNDPCFGFEATFSYVYDPQTLEVTFTNESSASATTFQWIFGDGDISSSENPVHVYDSARHYEVCLIVSADDGCIDTICTSLPLGVFICEPAFVVSEDRLTIIVTDVSVTSAPVQSRIWSFGDGHIAFDSPVVTHTYAGLGVYDLCMSIQSDSCTETVCQTLNLTDHCLLTRAAFEYVITGGTVVQFTDQSIGNISSRLWGFGDGNTSTAQNPVHEYASPGTYTACLLIFDTQNNCSEFLCREIQVQTTGVRDLTGVRPLILFPNPATSGDSSISLLGIALSDYGTVGKLSVYGMHGGLIASKEVICDEQISFTLDGEAAGIFIVELSTGRNVYVSRLMINDR